MAEADGPVRASQSHGRCMQVDVIVTHEEKRGIGKSQFSLLFPFSGFCCLLPLSVMLAWLQPFLHHFLPDSMLYHP